LKPLDKDAESYYEFEDNIKSGRVPSEYIPAVNKGFQAAMKKGPLAGYEIVGCKMCLDDGSYHSVDSSEMAFRTAAKNALIEVFKKSKPCLLEPIMSVEIEMPAEFDRLLATSIQEEALYFQRKTATITQLSRPKYHYRVCLDMQQSFVA